MSCLMRFFQTPVPHLAIAEIRTWCYRRPKQYFIYCLFAYIKINYYTFQSIIHPAKY